MCMRLPLQLPCPRLIRRLGHPDQVRVQQHELFKRMVFNILVDNTDDHEKKPRIGAQR